VEVEERPAGAALEALDAPAVDGEGALAAGGGYGLFRHVQVASSDTLGIPSTLALNAGPYDSTATRRLRDASAFV
jgi:hypothetical protein